MDLKCQVEKVMEINQTKYLKEVLISSFLKGKKCMRKCGPLGSCPVDVGHKIEQHKL